MKVGGFLFLTVPVGMELWSEHDVQAKHVRRYEFEEIETILNLSNIEILSYRYWNVIMRPILRLRRRCFRSNDISLPSRPVNLLLSAIIKLERLFPVGKLRGVSLIVVGRKTS